MLAEATRARLHSVAATPVRLVAGAASSNPEAPAAPGRSMRTAEATPVAREGAVAPVGASEAALGDVGRAEWDNDVEGDGGLPDDGEPDDDGAYEENGAGDEERPMRRGARRAASSPLRERVAGAAGDRLPPTLRPAMWSMDGRSVVVLVAVGVAAVVAAVLAFGGSPHTDAVVTPTFEPASSAPVTAPTDSGAPGTAVPTVVVVDVAGLVARPGVYELPAGSRVVDAISAAGGAIEGTDLSRLNLARVVSDGEQIAVGVPAAPDVPGGQATGPADAGPEGPLDLNTATEAQLDDLPGVGPVLAERIVAWREENGQFSSVEELMEVSGIGTATFADLEPLVRV